MGIVNVTPDSFSDGGLFVSREAALAQARKLVADGADIVDVGAESTRPGHTPVSPEDEWARLEPVLATLVAEAGAPVSIDTYKALTARRALAVGVAVVNDVWGLQRDPDMAHAVAEALGGRPIYEILLERTLRLAGQVPPPTTERAYAPVGIGDSPPGPSRESR